MAIIVPNDKHQMECLQSQPPFICVCVCYKILNKGWPVIWKYFLKGLTVHMMLLRVLMILDRTKSRLVPVC